ncbi:hypothetical protein KSS87_022670 [Heliosperma pusillum]|nr:hypothetical protein KSS87_001787 [Heliosperma pusillum]KAH9612555.1 hypothetical protein KSS87_001030 [Heliosperma pusillum]KAH9613209.1 hypothetical protein KSS87_022670 [Heliosperma pusillum]
MVTLPTLAPSLLLPSSFSLTPVMGIASILSFSRARIQFQQ